MATSTTQMQTARRTRNKEPLVQVAPMIGSSTLIKRLNEDLSAVKQLFEDNNVLHRRLRESINATAILERTCSDLQYATGKQRVKIFALERVAEHLREKEDEVHDLKGQLRSLEATCNTLKEENVKVRADGLEADRLRGLVRRHLVKEAELRDANEACKKRAEDLGKKNGRLSGRLSAQRSVHSKIVGELQEKLDQAEREKEELRQRASAVDVAVISERLQWKATYLELQHSAALDRSNAYALATKLVQPVRQSREAESEVQQCQEKLCAVTKRCQEAEEAVSNANSLLNKANEQHSKDMAVVNRARDTLAPPFGTTNRFEDESNSELPCERHSFDDVTRELNNGCTSHASTNGLQQNPKILGQMLSVPETAERDQDEQIKTKARPASTHEPEVKTCGHGLNDAVDASDELKAPQERRRRTYIGTAELEGTPEAGLRPLMYELYTKSRVIKVLVGGRMLAPGFQRIAAASPGTLSEDEGDDIIVGRLPGGPVTDGIGEMLRDVPWTLSRHAQDVDASKADLHSAGTPTIQISDCKTHPLETPASPASTVGSPMATSASRAEHETDQIVTPARPELNCEQSIQPSEVYPTDRRGADGTPCRDREEPDPAKRSTKLSAPLQHSQTSSTPNGPKVSLQSCSNLQSAHKRPRAENEADSRLLVPKRPRARYYPSDSRYWNSYRPSY